MILIINFDINFVNEIEQIIYGQEQKDGGSIKIRIMDNGSEKLFKLKNFVHEFSKM